MEKLKKQFKELVSKLPKPAKTKIEKSKLDRGGEGIFTARRKRSDKVIVPFDSFISNYGMSGDLLTETYRSGYRVLCSPSEYFNNLEILTDIPVIVRYQTYDEMKDYPANIDWDNVKKDRTKYSDDEIMWVIDIKNLDKHKKNGKSKYVGPSLIGQHEMDYASEEEMVKVQMCLLFQMINCIDFENEMRDNLLFSDYLKYSEEFKKCELYLDNPKLQKFTTKYGHTVCPFLINHTNKKFATIKFKDIVNGKVDGDLGREDFNRTYTKVNLHHDQKLISGKLNHNHKNVFLGSEGGNSMEAALSRMGIPVNEFF
jgi:hypothetical protein